MARTFFRYIRPIKCEAWRKQRQLNYLANCRQEALAYRKDTYGFDYTWRSPICTVPVVTLHSWYNWGFTHGWLTIDFQPFEKIVKGEVKIDSIYPRSESKQKRWRSRWCRRYSKKTAYRRNPEHQKKILTEEELQKREWKKKKRDRYNAWKATTTLKEENNSKRRQRIRYLIQKERTYIFLRRSMEIRLS